MHISKLKKKDRIPAGYAWIQGIVRLMYNARIIRRGKNKGKWECWYRKSATRWGKIILVDKQIKPLPVREGIDFSYDNPCPKCGKWLFHDEISPNCPNTKEKS